MWHSKTESNVTLTSFNFTIQTLIRHPHATMVLTFAGPFSTKLPITLTYWYIAVDTFYFFVLLGRTRQCLLFSRVSPTQMLKLSIELLEEKVYY